MVHPVLASVGRDPRRRLVNAAQVPSFRHVAQRRKTTFGGGEVFVVQGKRGQFTPHGFGLWVEFLLFQRMDGFREITVFDRRAKPNQCLLQLVTRGVDAFVHDDFGPAIAAFDLFDLPLDLVGADFVRGIDVVPHAQIVSVLNNWPGR
jgi:hypothetical protein